MIVRPMSWVAQVSPDRFTAKPAVASCRPVSADSPLISVPFQMSTATSAGFTLGRDEWCPPRSGAGAGAGPGDGWSVLIRLNIVLAAAESQSTATARGRGSSCS
jgi:hypothetical protein